MGKDIERVRNWLSRIVDDKAILEELAAINTLDFVKKTVSSCSGHVDCFGLLHEAPFLKIRYTSNNKDAQKFHKELTKINTAIEGRDCYLRPLDGREEYLICFPLGVHPRKDPLIGPKITRIPPDNPELAYNLLVPAFYNFENPRNRNVEILERFWGTVSELLAGYCKPIYQKRVFQHSYKENGMIDSPFRKDETSFGFLT